MSISLPFSYFRYMSLCIAKLIEGKIYINADSLVSGHDVVAHDIQRDSIMKAVLLNPQVCILFAGNVSVADNLLSLIHSNVPPKIGALISFIWEHQRKNDESTDYIIASTLKDHPRIIEIKDGRILQDVNTSWIGTKSGFSSFQKFYDVEKGKNTSLAEAFNSAFTKVMDDDSIKEVGGFRFSLTQYEVENVRGNPLILSYENHMFFYSVLDDEFYEENGFWDTRLESKANGGFAYSTLPSKSVKTPGVGLYFGHVHLGLMFSYRHFGLVPGQYRNCSSLEFSKEVAKIGGRLQGMAYEGDGGGVQIL